ncbi:MAG: ribbon-helix-helix protein, CopG family [Candidatus Omnitrophica bacterium]|nr:ribbon-helix-helix protein, CopG family [Candidatus Omnitrophota bacterium]
MSTTTLTIRVDERIKQKLDKLAKSTARSKSYLVTNAIEDFLSVNEWQIRETRKTLQKANQPGAQFIDHKKVTSWLDSWGSKNEQEPPYNLSFQACHI